MDDKTLKRYLSKVDTTDHARCKDHGCWMWTGSSAVGYGKFTLNYKNVSAHRLSYQHYNGEIPAGMVIRHRCPYEAGDRENTLCVNPAHLEIGTQKQNLAEGYTIAARNAQKNSCPKCSSDYTVKKNGKRYCKPCHNAYTRKWLQRSR